MSTLWQQHISYNNESDVQGGPANYSPSSVLDQTRYCNKKQLYNETVDGQITTGSFYDRSITKTTDKGDIL